MLNVIFTRPEAVLSYLYGLMQKSTDTRLQTLENLIDTEKFLQPAIISWYLLNKRPLPWRHEPEPYRVWLSEIILQQTRVDQGLPYYERFVAAYPDLASFARAPEEDILRLWQGLGYYSRARNMLTAARQVMEEHGGRFPVTAIQLKSLKGIGDYTAAAISSSCFNEPDAVVDGNVYRVLARYFGIDLAIDSGAGKRFFAVLAQGLLPIAEAAVYNQAIMDFGALQCKPAPLCQTCPLQNRCVALADHRVRELPFKAGKTKTRNRYFNYLIWKVAGAAVPEKSLSKAGSAGGTLPPSLQPAAVESVYILRRGPGDIWQGLFDFPLIETETELLPPDLLVNPAFVRQMAGQPFVLKSACHTFKHILSHQVIYARFWELQVSPEFAPENNMLTLVKKHDLHTYAMSRLALRYLETTSEE